MMEQESLETLLRKSLLGSDISCYRIACKTGLAKSALCRFLQGKTLTLRSAEKLIRYFGFEVRRNLQK